MGLSTLADLSRQKDAQTGVRVGVVIIRKQARQKSRHSLGIGEERYPA